MDNSMLKAAKKNLDKSLSKIEKSKSQINQKNPTPIRKSALSDNKTANTKQRREKKQEKDK